MNKKRHNLLFMRSGIFFLLHFLWWIVCVHGEVPCLTAFRAGHLMVLDEFAFTDTQGDYDNDSKLDYLAYKAEYTLVFKKGLGNGLFEEGPSCLIDICPYEGRAADVNLDSCLDIILLDDDVKEIQVLLGNGDGTFVVLDPVELGSIGTSFSFLHAEKLNEDSFPDLIVGAFQTAPEPDRILILNGVGDGTFEEGDHLELSNGMNYFDMADFNNDSNADIALVVGIDAVDCSMEVYMGIGDGTFEPPVITPLTQVFWDFNIGDFNADEYQDLVFLFGDIMVRPGQGDGTFGDPVLTPGNHWVSLPAYSTILLDGDDLPDLLIWSYLPWENAPQGFWLYRGNGDCSFASLDYYASGYGGVSIIADFDGREGQDIVSNEFPYLFLGSQNEKLRGARLSILEDGPCIAADYNNDGLADVVVDGVDYVKPLIGRGDGFFDEGDATPVTFREGSLFEAADFNNDDNLDLFQCGFGMGVGAASLLGDGSGHFTETGIFGKGTYYPSAIASGKLNNDNFLDLVVPGRIMSDYGVLIGLGDGTFEPYNYPLSGNPTDVVLGCFNQDEFLDAAFACYGSGEVTILQGLGDGTFSELGIYPTGESPVSLDSVDFDGDDNLDLVVTHEVFEAVSVLFGRGDGTFIEPPVVVLESTASDVVATDFDADRCADIAVLTSSYDFTVPFAFLKGDCEGGFASPVYFLMQNGPSMLETADFNGDRRPDLYSFARQHLSVAVALSDSCPDRDGDTVADASDNCPEIFNPDQENIDGDDFGDACDPCPADPDNDIDGDTVCGDVDNCPDVPNGPLEDNQADSDEDGLGDACDQVCDAEPSALDRRPDATPLTLTKAGSPGMLDLYWEPTVAGEYNLYRGTLASLGEGIYDHTTEGSCSLLEETTQVPMDVGDFYFLVVSRCGAVESSYGRHSEGTERPPAIETCP